MPYFDIKRDNLLIAAGSHFFCEACVVAWPLVEQSLDPRYCLSCFDVLKVEAALQPNRKASWIPRVAASSRKAATKPPKQQEPVAKIVQHGKPPITKKQGIMQQRGRPKKEGEVHRITVWRRSKQGVLL